MTDPYENLANAIIIQAAKDYRHALKVPGKPGNVKKIEECERFFRSQWLRLLTAIDGEALVEELRKEAGYGRRE